MCERVLCRHQPGIFIICFGFPHIICFHLLYYLRFIFFPCSMCTPYKLQNIAKSFFHVYSHPRIRRVRFSARGLDDFSLRSIPFEFLWSVFSLLLHFSLCKQHITHIFISLCGGNVASEFGVAVDREATTHKPTHQTNFYSLEPRWRYVCICVVCLLMFFGFLVNHFDEKSIIQIQNTGPEHGRKTNRTQSRWIHDTSE